MERAVRFIAAMLALAVAFSPVAGLAGHDGNDKRKADTKEKPRPSKPSVPENVAEGFPAWKGFETELKGSARSLSPADLRLRYTIVVEIKGNGNSDILKQFGGVRNLQGLGFNPNGRTVWNFADQRHDVIVIYNIHGGNDKTYDTLRGSKDLAKDLGARAYNFYTDVSFPGGPDAGGSYPYVYVMPPTGQEPLYKGKADSKTFKAVEAAIKKAKRKPWRDYYGFVEDVKFAKSYVAAVESGKPLAQAEAALLKAISGKNKEAAQEAQMLLDAARQKRGDLLYRIAKEHKESPLDALYDIDELARRWPAMKKDVSDIQNRISSQPDVATAYKAYIPFKKCADPGFKPTSKAEAAKLAADMRKSKGSLERLKDSKNVRVQNAAFTMLQKLETLPDEIMSRIGNDG